MCGQRTTGRLITFLNNFISCILLSIYILIYMQLCKMMSTLTSPQHELVVGRCSSTVVLTNHLSETQVQCFFKGASLYGHLQNGVVFTNNSRKTMADFLFCINIIILNETSQKVLLHDLLPITTSRWYKMTTAQWPTCCFTRKNVSEISFLSIHLYNKTTCVHVYTFWTTLSQGVAEFIYKYNY